MKEFENALQQQKENFENNLNDINRDFENLNKNYEEILEQKDKLNKLENDMKEFKTINEINKNKEDTNENKIVEVSKEIKMLKSEINNNNDNNMQKIKNSENEINNLKEENKNLIDKVNKLEEEIKKLKNEHEDIKYNDESNGMEMNIDEDISNNLTSERSENNSFNNFQNNFMNNGQFPQRIDNGNGFINNFFEQKIINVCFRIDGITTISIPAYPNDKLRDLFSLALRKNNLMDLEIGGYKFFYDAKNITKKVLSNESISSLNLNNNKIIEVQT